jgi:phosphoribosylformylglycinamidine synthase
MITRIEIGYKPGVRDPEGEAVAQTVEGYLHLPVDAVRTVSVYKIDAALRPGEADTAVEGFLDPVIQEAALGKLTREGYDWSITIGFRPGVTDNVGRTAKVTLQDMLGRRLEASDKVYTESRYLVKAPSLTRGQAERIATGCLANLLIETVRVQSAGEFEETPADESIPVMTGAASAAVNTVPLEGGDEELMRISREKVLSLNVAEMRTVRDYFASRAGERKALGLGPEPTDAELEVLAQTWSEHCKHKIFNARIRYREPGKPGEMVSSIFNTYIRGATEAIGKKKDFLVSVFHDNAGVVRFNEKWNVVYKVETHNSPSALDPYGGAITGIVGVNRDPFGTGRGAELLANVWGYCLGSPFHDESLPQGLLHPRRIRDGVHQGVIDGGNQSGIPYLRGFEWFDRRYLGKPLVYCGTLALMPREIRGEPAHVKVVKSGHAVVMVGGRIGKDGIHGATFSSQELHDASPVQAVQIGDPITQKTMTDFLLEARDQALYSAITDNGAGGLSSSVGEMAQYSGGCEIDLEKAPIKYEGLQPWEILLSEAQERMTLAVPPEQVDALLKLAEERDVEATVLGTFTDSGLFHVTHGTLQVACIEMDFMHEGCPVLELEAVWDPPAHEVPAPGALDVGALLERLNVCSKEEKSRQYDHEVKGLSIVKPFVGVANDIPSDASVMCVEHGKPEGVVLAEGINPRFSDVDTYWMAASVLDLALRRIVAAGGDPESVAGLDNFCWPDPEQSERTPDGHYKLAQLVRACRGLHDFSLAYGLPMISGKDSMKNDTHMGDTKISIPPTLLVSGVGKIHDVGLAMTPDAKCEGDAVYVLGMTRNEMGGSEYHAMLGGLGGDLPRVDPGKAMDRYKALHRCIGQGLVHSAHTPSLGGLGVGFAMVAMGGELGLEIDLGALPAEEGLDDKAALFSETNSRFIVTVAKADAERFEKAMGEGARVGIVTRTKKLVIKGVNGGNVVEEDVAALKDRWKGTVQGI